VDSESGYRELEDIGKRAGQLLQEAETLEDLEQLRVEFLGRSGSIARLFQGLRELDGSERPAFGKKLNEVKTAIEAQLGVRERELQSRVEDLRLSRESIDITLPGRRDKLGRRHLITRIIEEIEDVFIGLGYQIEEGPEVETDYYNFEALNTPEWHPAKSLADTFYMDEAGADSRVLLRTHTSPVQIRVMEAQKPPLFIISPGKAYRRDVPDASHTPMFHQVEGFAVDGGITLGDLKGTLELFCHEIFGAERKVRFRPHFFPFTEPSAEVDVSCAICEGSGCRLCKQTGWLEILGAGMIDPNVFGYVGYDPDEYSGFAFGVGVERIAALKYGIPDIRILLEQDFRFLQEI